MPCSHTRTNGDGESDGLERRDFMKSALLIGGTGAFSTARRMFGLQGSAGGDRITFAERDNRQHAWNAFLGTDDRGLPEPPHFHVMLFLNYQREGEPTAADRAEMEAALRQLEEAFQWGNQGLLFTVNYGRPYFDRFEESLPDGAQLLDNRESIEAMIKRDERFENQENPVAEPYDLFIDLASDHVPNLLAAEEALFGNVEKVNGVPIEHTLEGIFEKPTEFPDRRTGFVGVQVAGNNTEQTQQFEDFGNPNPEIEEKAGADAFLTMGFMSGHEDNQPSEDDVSLAANQQTLDGVARPPGQFAQGTVQHASRLDIALNKWYTGNDTARSTQMFSPFHSPAETGETGLELGPNSSPDEFPMRDEDADTDVARKTETTARNVRDAIEEEGGASEEVLEELQEEGTVIGHSQKIARSRIKHSARLPDRSEDATRQQLIIRRDFNTLDGKGEQLPLEEEEDEEGEEGETQSEEDEEGEQEDLIPPNSALHFLTIMRYNEDMITVREAMNRVGFTAPDRSISHESILDDELEIHGIHEYLAATRRGNFLMPPLVLRSLPTPRALDVEIDVEPDLLNDDFGVIVVEFESTADVDVDDVDPDTIRFGPRTEVNQARGASPKRVIGDRSHHLDKRILLFDAEETGFQESDQEQTARLFAKTDDGVAVIADEDVRVF